MVRCALAIFAESQCDRYLLTPLLLTQISFPEQPPSCCYVYSIKPRMVLRPQTSFPQIAVRSQGRRQAENLFPTANVQILAIVWSAGAGSRSVQLRRQPLVALVFQLAGSSFGTGSKVAISYCLDVTLHGLLEIIISELLFLPVRYGSSAISSQ